MLRTTQSIVMHGFERVLESRDIQAFSSVHVGVVMGTKLF